LDSAIVTVRGENGSFEYDMELSADAACGALSEKIAEALRAKDAEAARRIVGKPYLSAADGRRLPEDATLAGMGLWDGSVIILGSERL
jgi:hypothetical protein